MPKKLFKAISVAVITTILLAIPGLVFITFYTPEKELNIESPYREEIDSIVTSLEKNTSNEDFAKLSELSELHNDFVRSKIEESSSYSLARDRSRFSAYILFLQVAFVLAFLFSYLSNKDG